MNAKQAAAILGVSPRTVLDLATRRQLAHHRVGRRVVFRREDLEAYLARCRVEARGTPPARPGRPGGYVPKPDLLSD